MTYSLYTIKWKNVNDNKRTYVHHNILKDRDRNKIIDSTPTYILELFNDNKSEHDLTNLTMTKQ